MMSSDLNNLLAFDAASAPPAEFEGIFSPENLTLIFQKHISNKQTRGLDKITPRLFSQQLDANILRISQQCLNDKYQYTRYIERLILKKRDTPPRALCIPAVKDKIVLKALNQLLKQKFAEQLSIEVPNRKIRLIKESIQTGNYDAFVKIDIKSFYDCIDHAVLFRKIRRNVKSKKALSLLRKALQNAAVPSSYSRKENILMNKLGVHQGLPTSNILAEIYLADFDRSVRKLKNVAYFRYVDDILILTKKSKINVLKKSLESRLKKLQLLPNPEKTAEGTISEGLDYLGYKFRTNRITVRHSSKQKFLNSIFKEFIRLKYKKHSEELLIRKINLRITGAISENKRYGWISFFSEIDDIPLLYTMDKLIRRTASRFKVSAHGLESIKKLVRSYHEMKHTPRSGYIFNFDAVSKQEILINFGEVQPDAALTEDEWDAKFEKFKVKMLGSLEEDVGQFS